MSAVAAISTPRLEDAPDAMLETELARRLTPPQPWLGTISSRAHLVPRAAGIMVPLTVPLETTRQGRVRHTAAQAPTTQRQHPDTVRHSHTVKQSNRHTGTYAHMLPQAHMPTCPRRHIDTYAPAGAYASAASVCFRHAHGTPCCWLGPTCADMSFSLIMSTKGRSSRTLVGTLGMPGRRYKDSNGALINDAP